MPKITMTLELLGDGKWHEIEELRLKLGLNSHESLEIIGFLSRYNFVNFEEKNKRVKIKRGFRKLLTHNIT